jgi:hypothetical protein
MSALLEQLGKTGLQEGILVPVGGLDKLTSFIALLGANKLHLVVLHYRASKPVSRGVVHRGIQRDLCQGVGEIDCFTQQAPQASAHSRANQPMAEERRNQSLARRRL